MKQPQALRKDGLRLFHLFRTGSAPESSSFPYEIEHFAPGFCVFLTQFMGIVPAPHGDRKNGTSVLLRAVVFSPRTDPCDL